MDLTEQLERFVSHVEQGLFMVPPDPDAIGNFAPILDRIHRDHLGIIEQVQNTQESLDRGDPPILDAGDSAHKTGIAAFCNSREDQALLSKFETDGIMVRHPEQFPWNNPWNCSRDQLIAYTSGCWRAKRFDIGRRLLDKHLARTPPIPSCQNFERDAPGTEKDPSIGDLLRPHDITHLRICAGDFDAAGDLLGQFTLQLTIEVSDKTEDHEKTQALMQSIIAGRLNFFVEIHQNYRENIRNYFSGWRNEAQLGEALIYVVEEELKRYSGLLPFPRLLPEHTLDELRKLDSRTVLLAHIDPVAQIELGARFTKALASDAQADQRRVHEAAVAAIRKLSEKTQIPLPEPINPVPQTIEEAVTAPVTQPIEAAKEAARTAGKVAEKVGEVIDDIFGGGNSGGGGGGGGKLGGRTYHQN